MSGKIETLVLHVLGLLKMNVEEYCELETVDGDRDIVTQDGSRATIMQFHGSKCILGKADFEQMIARLDRSLSGFLSRKGHQLQIIFRRDLDSQSPLEQNAAQQAMSANRLSLRVGDLIEEAVTTLSRYTCHEECFLVFWSRPALLDSIEARRATQETNELRKEASWPSMANAQNLLRPITYLRDRHAAFVSQVANELSTPEFGCSVQVLDVAAALRAIRATAYPDTTSPDWSPSIPGTRIPFRWKVNDNLQDLSEFSYPTLPSQIMTATAEIGESGNKLFDPTMVRVGNRIYAPLLFAVPPRDPKTFNVLFDALNRSETQEGGSTRPLPYSISFMLESDGMSVLAMKSFFSSVLGFTSEQNRNINAAKKELQNYKGNGGCVVKLRISATTWSNAAPGDQKELGVRKSKLWRTLESWGNPVPVERTGNPMLAFATNALCLSPSHIAPPCPAPLGDALYLLPLTRPASPFATGSTIYRSLDGKILRYQHFSSEQTAWLKLIAGKQGSGKSALMNHNALETCLLPGLQQLPFICNIDIGISSLGLIDLIRDALPEHLKHQVLYRRLQNNERDATNPLDTALGMRVPLARDREFAKNFVTMLITPPERQGRPYEGMSNFVGRMIDMAYRELSDRVEMSSPAAYTPHVDDVLDKAIAKLQSYPVIPSVTTYWELVDALFKAGFVYEAEIAQRYAVPTLNELIGVASSESVREEYGDINVESGSPIIQTFIVGVREAIGDYPIFASRTQFDIRSARVMALDLQDVAIQGSDAARKQTALMYMIARYSFMRKVAFSTEDLPLINPLYRPYYQQLVTALIDEPKVLCMDEFHKTGGHEGLRRQILTDGREMRKWNMELILASQIIEDFGDLTKIATTVFILDSGTEETRRWLRTNIGLSQPEEDALVSRVHGANEHGATFLARIATKSATYSQLYTATLGPLRLWALSTTPIDRKLRTLIYAALPGPEARRLLAQHFPSGSAQKYVERKKLELSRDSHQTDDEMVEQSVIEQIAASMLRSHTAAL